ncbi:hypothetical protein AB6D15_09165 [Vibrio splendidus]
MSKKYKNINMYASVLEMESIESALSNLKSEELFPVRDSLISNVANLSNVCLLPVSIAYRAVHQTEWVERFRRALGEGKPNGTKAQQKAELEKRMDRLDNSDTES